MRRLIITAVLLSLFPLYMPAQDLGRLWKQAEEAEKEDHPRTALQYVDRIISVAERQKAFGHLLKAEAKALELKYMISPDSLEPARKRMKERADASLTSNPALAAVYDAVLGNNERAMSNPEALARAKSKLFDPMITHGVDSRYFGDDLLHIIGIQTKRYEPMAAYYTKAGNREAAFFSKLWLRDHSILSLDSLIEEYGDMDIAGEAALARYRCMITGNDYIVKDYVDYIHYAVSRWPQWKRIDELRNEERRLTAPAINAEYTSIIQYPGVATTVKLTDLRHISGIKLTVSRVNVDGRTEKNPDDTEQLKELKSGAVLMSEKTVTRSYSGHADYELFDDSISIPPIDEGVYLIELKADGVDRTLRQLFFVSRLSFLAIGLPGSKSRIAVVDSRTGQPIAGALITLTPRYYQWGLRETEKALTLTSDKNGEVVTPLKAHFNYDIYVSKDDDKAFRQSSLSADYRYDDRGKPATHHTEIFTDRRIYRPGQTVHVATVSFMVSGGLDSHAEQGEKISLSLYDVNGKEVGKKVLTTDSMGVAATDFIIPSDRLTGRYTLRAPHGIESIRVEEYKRPTFRVTVDKVNENYKAGDTIDIRGYAVSYGGVPMQQAKVTYIVTRRPQLWWLWLRGGKGSEEIKKDSAMTDEEGRFTMSVPLNTDKETCFYNFDIEATVTIGSGESHTSATVVPLSNRAAALFCSLEDKILADSLKDIIFTVKNSVGNNVDALVTYSIDGGPTATARTDRHIALPEMKSGRHQLVATAEGDTLRKTFVIFHLDDRRPCTDTDEWLYVSAAEFPSFNYSVKRGRSQADDSAAGTMPDCNEEGGGAVTVQAGSSSDIHLLYNIFSEDRILESGTKELNDELWNRRFRYKKEYGSGIMICVAWMKDGIAHTWTTTITRPLPDKQLKTTWKTFRDRLEPGQKEQWTLNITGSDGTPARARLIATLYDKSLDQILRNRWTMSLGLYQSQPLTDWTWQSVSPLYKSETQPYKNINVKSLLFSSLYMPDLRWHIIYDDVLMMRRQPMALMSASSPLIKKKNSGSAREESSVGMSIDESKAESDEESGSRTVPIAEQSALREKLGETAFFYWALMTDAEGNVTMSFTLPESVTTWHFMGMAHTSDMKNTLTEADAIAQKDLMVQPNMPRFIRIGDNATISATISNLSEREEKGTVTMRLIDPETDNDIADTTLLFTVGGKRSVAVNFVYKPKEDAPSLLICRIIANGSRHSDGEQHYLPILPDKETVTTALPFTQNGKGEKVIPLEPLFPYDGTHNHLTIEYTNNPVWMMIQALPMIAAPRQDNAVSLAAALYVDVIGRDIISSKPFIRHIIEKWNRENSDETSLHSALEKNAELKDMALEETPWLMDAEGENEQKRRLIDFFDENTMNARLSGIEQKLKELQSNDGAWHWWPGMRGSMYLTVDIAEMLVRLKMIVKDKAYGTDLSDMLDKAFDFMGRETIEQVERMKEWEMKGNKPSFPGMTTLQWLYICRIDGRKLPADVVKANNYLIALLKKDIKNQTIYSKALSAIILDNKSWAQSLKEYTVYREETGRYYDTNRASYSWKDYRIPTQVAAIEALKRLTPADSLTISDMQRWLLHEKRTQAWDTPINSINAIYAFFLGNSDALRQREMAVLSVDSMVISAPATSGMGYMKKSMDVTLPHLFKAEKTSGGTSWGALYAEYVQASKSVSDYDGAGIRVKREIIGKPILTVGDKVKERLTITCDRDLDFVEVISRRAACMEPLSQISGYLWRQGCYCAPKDNATHYFFDSMAKGTHEIETEYFIDRQGTYSTGTVTVQCAYAPEYRGTAKGVQIVISK